jgi:hypothetical protein
MLGPSRDSVRPEGEGKMSKRSTLGAIVVAIAVCGLVFVAGAASAGGGAVTKVTIKAQSGDFSGFVSSPKPHKCANHRLIWVYKQKGKNQNPSVDSRLYMDTADLSGGRYAWDTGNTGASGKFYARAGKIPGCKADTSKTVRTHK